MAGKWIVGLTRNAEKILLIDSRSPATPNHMNCRPELLQDLFWDGVIGFQIKKEDGNKTISTIVRDTSEPVKPLLCKTTGLQIESRHLFCGLIKLGRRWCDSVPWVINTFPE